MASLPDVNVWLALAFQTHSAASSAKSSVWSDAYIAAFGMAAGLRVVTFDQGFLKFEEADAEILR